MLNDDVTTTCDRDAFRSNLPFPWVGFQGILASQSFDQLEAEFPPLDLFEKHERIPRTHGQRPHDRYYLALDRSIYGTAVGEGPGCVGLDALSPSWQQFITSLRGDERYKRLVSSLLRVDDYVVRFAWHVASAGADVSPHVDASNKYGTHIFYFNSENNWREE